MAGQPPDHQAGLLVTKTSLVILFMIPATFRNWPDYEDRAATIRTWTPGIIDGLVQCEDYSHALIAVQPGVTAEVAAARLSAHSERQCRVLDRQDSPPSVWVIVDEMALHRQVGTPAVMASQMRRLVEMAARPQVTLTVMPAIAHAANASGFVLADDAAWCEHPAAGGVYTDPQIVTGLAQRFDSLRADWYRASDSLALIDRMPEIRTAGVSPLTQMATAGECVELASDSEAILVRDTANRDGGTLTFTPEAWAAFTTSLK